MKKYYAFTPHNKLVYIGEFNSFGEAFDYADYEININHVWIISDVRLAELRLHIDEILGKSQEN